MSSLRYKVIFTVLFCVVYGQQNCNIQEYHKLTEIDGDSVDKYLVRNVSRSSSCNVRETIVELETDFGMEVFPNRVAVKRCTGMSGNNELTCMSIENKIVTMVVRGVGARNDEKFHTIEIEEDRKCMMKCMVKEKHCNAHIHDYNKDECRCVCKDDGSEACHAQTNMKWNYETCKCVCNKPMLECPGDYYWVPAKCKCLKMMPMNEK